MAGIGLERVSAFVMAVSDLVGARDCWLRLGLAVTAISSVGETGLENCRFSIGGPENPVQVELLAIGDRDRVLGQAGQEKLVPFIDAGGGPLRLVLAVADVDVARSVLAAQPGGLDERLLTLADGSVVRILDPGDTTVGGCPYVIVEDPPAGNHPLTAMGDSRFPLKRVDHIAVLPPDIEAGTRYWTDVLGVPLHAELAGPGFLIRQLKVGDVMVELLASEDPNGPLAGAAPGLRPTVACEVDDLEASVAVARERGFTVPDPRVGALPGTLVAVIPPEELAGLSLQLLQYV